MTEKRDDIENWVKEAVKKGYSNGEIRELLMKNGYSYDEIKNILSLRASFGKIEKEKSLQPEKKKKLADDGLDFSKGESIPKEIRESYELLRRTREEMAKTVVGQKRVIDAFMCALLCDGHVLLEGVPGIAKTLIVKTLAKAAGCS